MSYLLDTNTVSYLIEKRPAIISQVAHAGGVSNLRMTAITVAELRFGVERMTVGKKKRDLLADLEAIIGSIEVLPFDQDAAAAYGWAAAMLESAGVGFDFPDLAIASIALAEHMTVASNDRFFGHVETVCGLRFERWIP